MAVTARRRAAAAAVAVGAAALGLIAVARLAGAQPAAGGVIAGKISVVRAGGGADATGVVVYVVGFTEPAPAEAAEVRQKKKKFLPELLPITAGQKVTFPNDDPFFHNVFSPSPARKFDLGQYPHGRTKEKRFPQAGVIEVFCNIHPEMAATILVLPNRRFTRAAADGSFRIDGVPPGRWKVFAYSRRAVAPVSVEVTVAAGQTAAASLAVTETRESFDHANKYGERYRDPTKYR